MENLKTPEDLLTKGLIDGYAGKGKKEHVKRGIFNIKRIVQAPLEQGSCVGVYHDEYCAERTGAGQEIVVLNGKGLHTRVYAGGVVSEELLLQAETNEKDVIKALKDFILEAGGDTRLNSYYRKENGLWVYEYRILEEVPEIPLVVGMETLSYKYRLVFAHSISHTPIR